MTTNTNTSSSSSSSSSPSSMIASFENKQRLLVDGMLRRLNTRIFDSPLFIPGDIHFLCFKYYFICDIFEQPSDTTAASSSSSSSSSAPISLKLVPREVPLQARGSVYTRAFEFYRNGEYVFAAHLLETFICAVQQAINNNNPTTSSIAFDVLRRDRANVGMELAITGLREALAHVYRQKGMDDSAEQEFEQCIAIYQQYFESDNYSYRQQCHKPVLLRYLSSYATYSYIRKNLERSLALYRRCYELDIMHPHHYMCVANCLIKLGRIEECVRWIESEIASHATNAQFYYRYALILRKHFMDYTRAEVYYRKALAIDKYAKNVNGSFGYLLLKVGGRYEESLKHLRIAVERDTDNAHGFYYFGLLMKNEHCFGGCDYFACLRAWQQSLQIDKYHTDSCFELCSLIAQEINEHENDEQQLPRPTTTTKKCDYKQMVEDVIGIHFVNLNPNLNAPGAESESEATAAAAVAARRRLLFVDEYLHVLCECRPPSAKNATTNSNDNNVENDDIYQNTQLSDDDEEEEAGDEENWISPLSLDDDADDGGGGVAVDDINSEITNKEGDTDGDGANDGEQQQQLTEREQMTLELFVADRKKTVNLLHSSIFEISEYQPGWNQKPPPQHQQQPAQNYPIFLRHYSLIRALIPILTRHYRLHCEQLLQQHMDQALMIQSTDDTIHYHQQQQKSDENGNGKNKLKIIDIVHNPEILRGDIWFHYLYQMT